MKKKYFIIIMIFCLVMLVNVPMVKAEDANTLEREMGLACALSYVPLTENKTIGFDLKGVEFINNIVNTVNAKINVHDYASIEELDGWVVADFRNKEITEKSMAAFVLQKDKDLIIVFRGTDMEWFADFLYGVQNRHNQEEYANKYVLEIMEEYSQKEGNYNIYVTGHSLGGYLAQTAGAKIAQNIDKYENLELKKIVTFNGIGINFFTYFGDKYDYGNQNETIKTLKELGEQEKLIGYYTYGDLVSALGVHYGEMRMLLPSIDSVEYHRTNYTALGFLNQKLNFSKLIEKYLIEDDMFNVFKTDLAKAKNVYKVDSMIAYLNLTHEADAFATIENEKSIKEPELKTIESKGVLSEYLQPNKNFIETNKSIKIRAVTSYASAKKYVWEVSSDKQNWEIIKVSTVDPNDPQYNPKEDPTNTLDINIKEFKAGETKYYRVTSFYDDNYTSSKYNFNEEKGNLGKFKNIKFLEDVKGEYEYVIDEEKSKKEEPETIQKIIEIKRKPETKGLATLKQNLNTIINKTSSIFKIFKWR